MTFWIGVEWESNIRKRDFALWYSLKSPEWNSAVTAKSCQECIECRDIRKKFPSIIRAPSPVKVIAESIRDESALLSMEKLKIHEQVEIDEQSSSIKLENVI